MMRVNADFLQTTSIDPAVLEELKRRAGHRVSFEVLGSTLAVWFENPAAADIFRRRYSAFSEGNTPAFHCFAVEAEQFGPMFWAQEGPQFYWPTPLVPRCIAFLADAVSTKAFFNSRVDLVSFHAAAIRVGDVSAAIVASTNGGKTTTAIACARRGMQLYSDERCIISDKLVFAFPRNINIRSKALDMLVAQDVPGDAGITDRLRKRVGGDWHSASFQDIFASSIIPPPQPLAAIFFITGSDRVGSVEPLSASASISRLAASGLRSAIRGLDRVALIASLRKDVRCYSLRLGSPDETALLIQHTVTAASAKRSQARSA